MTSVAKRRTASGVKTSKAAVERELLALLAPATTESTTTRLEES